jgi:hypothetical protein
MRVTAIARLRVWGTANAWSFSPDNGLEPNQEYDVRLEIVGDDTNGYHFVMAPEGFFAADTWHLTKDEALDIGLSICGVTRDGWTISS